jgi:uncharacterized membrane protein
VDPAAVVLMLAAGVFHASWHAIVKTGSSLSVLAGMGLVSAVLTLPFLFLVPLPSMELWPILLLSLGLHAAYKVILGVSSFAILLWALSRNPVASVVAFRECSVLFAALIGVLLLKEKVSGKNLLSIALVATGLIVVATSK